MISCIRIEHPIDGKGLFQNTYDEKTGDGLKDTVDAFNMEVCRRHNDMDTPWSDPNLDRFLEKKEWFCAYKNLDQLALWMDNMEIREVLEHGYNIYQLSVNEFQVGSDQIMYTKESIERKENINQLFL